ncbi:MAG: hypothetical protein PWQ75_889 [Methanolobus sp.]|jgi:hypothetical protein|uniref:hypothetical protein n=1 Tax=Methanolobus sp. TaxID=1874737 RepID=UPI0024AA5AE5|nr:hypothetical protein [Methanolobus sp.]MDI3486052.1 hypothetical protein [Methanolobus sp.]MDK2831137.1 hypothetical protein [Methanolobus sp.]
MKRFFADEKGVSLLFEYILFSLICIGFFMIVSVNSDEIFMQTPNEVVMQNEMSDIGNMMSTMITDMYIILPANGRIETKYNIPPKVGTETYIIEAHEDLATNQSKQIIEVVSSDSGKEVRVTIAGIAKDMLIEGTVTSSSTNHMISYDSRR